MEEEKNRQLESLLEEEKRSHEENLNHLNEKLKQEYALLAAEQQRALESKMEEQKALLTQGFHQQEQELREQIQQLKKEQAEREAEEARLRHEEARLQREEEKQTAKNTMQFLGRILETYYKFQQKREDRRLQDLLAQQEKSAYKNNMLKDTPNIGEVPEVPKVKEVPKGKEVPGSSEGLPAGQKKV